MTPITDEIINNSDDYSLFILLKKYMTNGEIRLPNLSSKNRSALHRLCYNYGLEHFSTGNYKNRTIIIKDPNHTYFSENTDQFHILRLNTPKEKTSEETQTTNETNHYNFIGNLFNSSSKKIEEEIVEEEIVEEDDEEIEEEEEVDTDTYSSDSEESECSECSETSPSLLYLQNNYISNRLDSLRMLSYLNLVMNIVIICNL
jgi:hypothetical protein